MYGVQGLFVYAYLRPFPTAEEWQFLGGRRKENTEKNASALGRLRSVGHTVSTIPLYALINLLNFFLCLRYSFALLLGKVL